MALESLGYEGARQGRRTEGWQAVGTSADAAAQPVVGTLRNRARDLVRNNPYAARAVDVKTSHTIGTGITAEVRNRGLARMWEDFVGKCDADGHTDLNGLLALMERCRFESGECLVRFVRTGSLRDTPIPTQIQVLEPDYLDSSRDTLTIDQHGRQTRHGIVYEGPRVVGYWLFREHPGEAYSMTRGGSPGFYSELVPAEDVIHVYRTLRPGQMRGVTELAPVMMRMRDLDDWQDAKLMRAKVEACLAALVTRPEGPAAGIGEVSTDAKGRVEKLYPGMVGYLNPGEQIDFLDPKTASASDSGFNRDNLLAVAAGTGIPYELLTSDRSEVNYTSMRGGLIDFRKRIQQDQWLVYIPQVCRRIEQRFREDLARIRPGTNARTAFEWTPPKYELMDPLKETQASLEAVLAGFAPWDEIAREHGWNGDDLLDAIAAWFKKLDDRGITLKSDPRTGMRATPAPPDDAEDEEAA